MRHDLENQLARFIIQYGEQLRSAGGSVGIELSEAFLRGKSQEQLVRDCQEVRESEKRDMKWRQSGT